MMVRRLGLVACSILLALPVAAAPAAAADPLFVGWSTAIPPLADTYVPGSADDCAAGRPQCVEKTIRAMSSRLDPLAQACAHNAVFALAYLRTTQVFAQAAAEPAFFTDAPFVNHEDAVFAKYYFSAYDAWAAGRREAVPAAWQIVLDAATGRRASGSGNLLLGMSAHVNRDLPFVLAAIGLVAPDGSSRKPDHDQVNVFLNVFLNRVVEPLLAEEAARFDPAIDDANTPYGLSYSALMQLLVSWRETAWRNAERLVNAPDDASRAQVAQQIEDYAVTTAQSLMLQYGYVAPLSSSASRDAYCATHHG